MVTDQRKMTLWVTFGIALVTDQRIITLGRHLSDSN